MTPWWRRVVWLSCVAFAPLAAVAGLPAVPGDLIFAHGFDRPVQGAGGSVYQWYALGPACDREPYGILVNYAQPGVRAIVQQQLAAMHAAGQQRLSIGQHFAHGWHTGSVVDAADPVQVGLVAGNLADFLVDIQAAGFAEVLFRLYPVGVINPASGQFDRALFTEYWDLVQSLRAVLVGSGITYRYDLFVEGMPRDRPAPWPVGTPADSDWSWAARRLWENYTATFGKADTIGFSFLTDDDPDKLRLRVRHMDYVYRGDPPPVVGVDIYGTAAASESDKLLRFAAALRQYGYGAIPWVIPEVWYDDPLAAAHLSSALAVTQPSLLYLTQWPLDRANTTCAGTAVTVAPPLDWLVYGGYGY